jgi:2-polyprenyl-3-methyl-5-hydroxy-6-metoxy-1,4-benzoquinol methylase
MEDKLYEDVNEGVLRNVGSGQRILDVGCGTGTLGLEIKKKGNVVWGLDNSEKAINLAKEKLDRVFLCDVADFDRLPIKGEKFDVIVLADILEHLNEPEKVLKEYKKYLKKDGHVIVSLPNIASWTIRLKQLFGPLKPSKYGILDETHKHHYNLEKAKKLVINSGYKITYVDVNPNILRAVIPPLRRVLACFSTARGDAEWNKSIIDSRFYLLYKLYILPIELILAKTYKNKLSFQFIIIGK